MPWTCSTIIDYIQSHRETNSGYPMVTDALVALVQTEYPRIEEMCQAVGLIPHAVHFRVAQLPSRLGDVYDVAGYAIHLVISPTEGHWAEGPVMGSQLGNMVGVGIDTSDGHPSGAQPILHALYEGQKCYQFDGQPEWWAMLPRCAVVEQVESAPDSL